jgi:Zn-dependent protease with chaperone function
MHLAVYLPLVMPLLAAASARPLAGRLPPVAATWLLAGSAVALAAASTAVLGLLALTALVRLPLVDAAGEMSMQVISRGDPASVPVAVAAGVLLAAAAAGACRALWRRTAALIAAGRQARRLPGAGQVVVTDDEAADAYTLPGWPCRIVVTAGMMRALSHPERQVLLAHERAHASGLHYLFTTAARLAAAANPLLRPVAAAVGYTVERWADERAAGAAGDRQLAARAIATAALPPRRLRPARLATAPARWARSPARPGCGAPGRCRAASRPCSARRHSPGCCCSPRPSSWSRSPGPPPWKPPATCTACSTTPAPSARPDPAVLFGRVRGHARDLALPPVRFPGRRISASTRA